MAIINCYALRFSKLFAQTDASIQEIPPATRCTKEAITDYTLNFKPGERFKCSYHNQDWRCVKTTKGYSCDVTENWPTEPPKQEEPVEPPKPPVPEEPPKPLVPEEPPQPSHVEELVEPPVHEELPKPPVHEELPKPPVHEELPKPPVHEELPKPVVPEAPPKPIVPAAVGLLKNSQLKLSFDEEFWLQQNVFKSKNLNLIYSTNVGNFGQKQFKESVSRARAGTFYLAKGHNGVILGAMTTAHITTAEDGWNIHHSWYTSIFSLTNKKVYDCVTGYGVTADFSWDRSNIGFGVFADPSYAKSWDWGLFLKTKPGTSIYQPYTFWTFEARAGTGSSGWVGYRIDKDQFGNNLMTNQPDGPLDLEILEVYEVI